MNNKIINSNYITGLTDGDGNFYVGVYPNPKSKLGWSVMLRYVITAGVNPSNYAMLISIKEYFGGIGNISINTSDNTYNYAVTNLKDCLIIQNHFINYPLLTYKLVYFQLWSAVLNIMISGGKLNIELINIILGYKAHFRNGLSEELLKSFPNYIEVIKPIYLPNFTLMNMHWLAGFINADGSFSLTIHKEPNRKLGEACGFYLSITQNEISKIVLDFIAEMIGTGFVYFQGKGTYVYKINSIKNINTFINKFKESDAMLLGAKALDYSDFCKGISIVNSKAHLTKEGLEEFRTISKNMNTNRTYFGE